MLKLSIVCALTLFAAAQNEKPSIRVLTYNIHHGEGRDGILDLERIANVIRSCDPDVVCLQEVDRNLPRTNHIDMPARLAELLDMEAVFEANYRFDGGEYGNATLTRLPIVGVENRRLPGPPGVEPRGCLRTDVRWRNETVSIFNTHWGLKPAERLEQATETAEFMDGHRHAVLAGDLNATPESEPLAIVLDVLADSATSVASAGRADLNTVRGRRIDYVLGLKPEHAAVIRDEVSEVASDHLPYFADLVLPHTD